MMVKSDGLKNIDPKFKKIVIKVGSNVVTGRDGSMNEWRISRLVEELAVLYRWGIDVILVTSGAVAAGRGEVSMPGKMNIISARQVLAAVGQVRLMSKYQYFFGKFGIPAGQVLASKESFRDRMHYLNMKNCISAMLENRVIPVVNENDTISIDELMFTDNDELSGLVASMMDATSLVILSNVDGIFRGDPSDGSSELIREVDDNEKDLTRYIRSSKSVNGRGGMNTKYINAMKIASEGIDVFIANGNRDSVLTGLVRGKDIPCTRFRARSLKEKSIRKWISHSETFAKGAVMINRGAKEALLAGKASLLMVGITSVEGSFLKGDIVSILDENRKNIGLGKAQYDSLKAGQSMGQKMKKPFIHCDYLVINGKHHLLPAG